MNESIYKNYTYSPYLRYWHYLWERNLQNVSKLVELTEALIKTESKIRDLEFQAKTIQYRMEYEQ